MTRKMAGSKKHSSAKNKPFSGKDKFSVARELGEGLVGSRVKVWWPIDRKFYDGVVDSYVSSKKKHRILYDDGDVEILDMKKQTWELINDAEADEIPMQDVSADDSEEGKEKAKSGVKKAEKTKGVEKKTPNPKTDRNGIMGDIGGKIVAAASRMSGMFRSKENGHAKEVSESKKPMRKRPSSSSVVYEVVKLQKTSSKRIKTNHTDDEEGGDDDESKPKTLKFSKKVSQSKNSKQKAVSEDGCDAKKVTSDDESKHLIPSKVNGQEKEIQKSLKSNKKVSESNNRKRPSFSWEPVILEKKQRTTLKETKCNDDASDDEATPLVSFFKKSPEKIEALMEKLKKKKKKKEKEAGEGEGTCGNETQVEEESSLMEKLKKEKEPGDGTCGKETEVEEEASLMEDLKKKKKEVAERKHK